MKHDSVEQHEKKLEQIGSDIDKEDIDNMSGFKKSYLQFYDFDVVEISNIKKELILFD